MSSAFARVMWSFSRLSRLEILEDPIRDFLHRTAAATPCRNQRRTASRWVGGVCNDDGMSDPPQAIDIIDIVSQVGDLIWSEFPVIDKRLEGGQFVAASLYYIDFQLLAAGPNHRVFFSGKNDHFHTRLAKPCYSPSIPPVLPYCFPPFVSDQLPIAGHYPVEIRYKQPHTLEAAGLPCRRADRRKSVSQFQLLGLVDLQRLEK